MYINITKTKIEGKHMTAIFYNEEKIPIKTVHFGAEGYDDCTIPPHDADKQRPDILKYTRLGRSGMILQQPARSQGIFYGTIRV